MFLNLAVYCTMCPTEEEVCLVGSRYFLVQSSILIFAYVTTAQWGITKNSHKKERHYRRAGRPLRHRFGVQLF